MGPILRALARNRTRSGLLVVEIAVTLTIVLNCLGLMIEQRRDLIRPTGIDEDNLIAVRMQPWGSRYADETVRRDIVRRDLESLRALAGVRDASAISPFPLQGGGSSLQLKPLGAPDSAIVRAPRYTADEHVLETLGLELVAGRGFTAEDVPLESGPRILNTIITQDLADVLFPAGDALGRTIDTGSAEWPDVIVGIVKQMHTPYGGGPMEDRILIYPGVPGGAGSQSYLVRADPEQRDHLIGEIDALLLRNADDRVVEVLPLSVIKDQGAVVNRFLVGLLGAIIFLLLFVTGLGLFGMTAFSITRRTKEIGTRRALGASRAAVMAQFLLEIAVLGAVGTALGLFGAVALNAVLVANLDGASLGVGLMVAGLVLLWVIGLLATLAPVLRAARCEPALATRTV